MSLELHRQSRKSHGNCQACYHDSTNRVVNVIVTNNTETRLCDAHMELLFKLWKEKKP